MVRCKTFEQAASTTKVIAGIAASLKPLKLLAQIMGCDLLMGLMIRVTPDRLVTNKHGISAGGLYPSVMSQSQAASTATWYLQQCTPPTRQMERRPIRQRQLAP